MKNKKLEFLVSKLKSLDDSKTISQNKVDQLVLELMHTVAEQTDKTYGSISNLYGYKVAEDVCLELVAALENARNNNISEAIIVNYFEMNDHNEYLLPVIRQFESHSETFLRCSLCSKMINTEHYCLEYESYLECYLGLSGEKIKELHANPETLKTFIENNKPKTHDEAKRLIAFLDKGNANDKFWK